MSRESLVILIGIVVFFVPYLGVPEIWKTYLLVGSGILLMVLGYLLRRAAYLRNTESGNGLRRTDSYVESTRKEKQEHTNESIS